jgi:hypothetical protein
MPAMGERDAFGREIGEDRRAGTSTASARDR